MSRDRQSFENSSQNPSGDRPQFDPAFVRGLYADFMNGAQPAGSASGTPTSDARGYLDLSVNPYSGISDQHDFATQHPWRAKVLNEDAHLSQELIDDRGHLGGHFSQLEHKVEDIKREEQRDARSGHGHITKAQEEKLLHEESSLQHLITKDHTGSVHHRRPGGDPPPNPPEGPQPPGGPTPNPPEGPQPPGGPTPNPPETPGLPKGQLVGGWILPSTVGAHSEQQAVQNFDNQIGNHQIGINNFYAPMGTMPDLSTMQSDVSKGIVPMLSLHGLNSSDVASGKDDAYLNQVANELKQVNGNVLLRYGWEMDGSKNQSWAQSPQEYIAAWQHIHNLFQQNGVTNAKWVWSPNAFNFDTGKSQQYYPGNNYVDYIASDGYSGINGESYKTPDQLFDSSYNFAESKGKPFMIAETGVSSGLGTNADVQFIQQMEQWMQSHPDTKALNWFSSGNNTLTGPELTAFEQMLQQLQNS